MPMGLSDFLRTYEYEPVDILVPLAARDYAGMVRHIANRNEYRKLAALWTLPNVATHVHSTRVCT